jgi:hypothetical protein
MCDEEWKSTSAKRISRISTDNDEYVWNVYNGYPRAELLHRIHQAKE